MWEKVANKDATTLSPFEVVMAVTSKFPYQYNLTSKKVKAFASSWTAIWTSSGAKHANLDLRSALSYEKLSGDREGLSECIRTRVQATRDIQKKYHGLIYLDSQILNAILMHTIAAHVCIPSQVLPQSVEKLQKHHNQRTGCSRRRFPFNRIPGAE